METRTTTRRGRAIVDDVALGSPGGTAGPGSPGTDAYLVRPDRPGPGAGAGIVFWHWLDTEAPDGNRTQYLDEAADLAELGVVSLLPQGRFPWAVAPDNAVADAAEVRAEVARLRAGLTLLARTPGVDPDRLAIVGHDYGGMLATLAAAEEPGLRALVVIAATPRWGDWNLRFWRIADDRIDYLRAIRPLDPVERIGSVAAADVLLQFGERDFYIAPMTALELHRAAPRSELRTYDTGHDMRLPGIRADRRAFLVRTLGLEPMDRT